jgi:hypothetical protein
MAATKRAMITQRIQLKYLRLSRKTLSIERDSFRPRRDVVL